MIFLCHLVKQNFDKFAQKQVITFMIVANAIYDVVFKYLLEDRSIAKLFLSALLKTEVIDLELKP